MKRILKTVGRVIYNPELKIKQNVGRFIAVGSIAVGAGMFGVAVEKAVEGKYAEVTASSLAQKAARDNSPPLAGTYERPIPQDDDLTRHEQAVADWSDAIKSYDESIAAYEAAHALAAKSLLVMAGGAAVGIMIYGRSGPTS